MKSNLIIACVMVLSGTSVESCPLFTFTGIKSTGEALIVDICSIAAMSKKTNGYFILLKDNQKPQPVHKDVYETIVKTIPWNIQAASHQKRKLTSN